MKIFRNPGLMIAVFWCAAMVMAPLAAAAGAGQGWTNDPAQKGNLQADPGNDPGQGSGSGQAAQNNAFPGQGSRPQGLARGNGTAPGNHTPFADNGNLTAPPEKPDWDPDNATASSTTSRHGPWGGNISARNMTDIPPPGAWDRANVTAAGQGGLGRGDGNMTPPVSSQGSGADPGQPGDQIRQEAVQKNSSESLIAELMSWLKSHGLS